MKKNKEIDVFKVVHKRGHGFYSAIINDPYWEIKYKIGEWVEPHNITSPLGICVFLEEYEALNWINYINYYAHKTSREDIGLGELCVFRAKALTQPQKGLMKFFRGIKREHDKKKRKFIFSPSSYRNDGTPSSTLFVKNVFLGELVESFPIKRLQ